jgi:Tfp pilus assembly protein PilO
VKLRPPIVVGIVAGLASLGLVLFLLLPKVRQVSDAKEELRTAQDQEIALRSQLRALQDAQAQAPETEKELRALEAKVPPTADLPGLFRLLQATADRAAVDFFQFSPGSPSGDPSAGFSIIPSQITVTGTYFSLQEFLYRLESLPRASKVVSVSITPGSEGESATAQGSRLQMQIAVEFYTTDTSAGPGSVPGPGGGASPSSGSKSGGSTASDGEAA